MSAADTWTRIRSFGRITSGCPGCGYLSDLYGEPNDTGLVFWTERDECGLRA